jgi:iron complex outermembrane receptor protein
MSLVEKQKGVLRALLAALGLVLCLGSQSFAEEKEKTDTFQLDTMVVTAEKRQEDLQEVPASVTAIKEARILDSGISSLQDFSNQVPNLFIDDWGFRGNSYVFIRGVGAINNDPAVGFYVDDVNYMDDRVFDSNLFDIERIEVLRGPQGTLYGRNSLGGVINIITKKPDNAFHAGVDQTFGNYGLLETNLYVRAPLIDDKLFFGFSGNLEDRDGYSHNEYLDEDGDDREDRSGRVQLRWTPNSKLDVLASIDGEQIDDGAFPVTNLHQVDEDPHRFSHNVEGEHERNSIGSSLKVVYDAEALSITSITGFRHYDDNVVNDQDFTAADLYWAKEVIRDSQFSQEFRFASPKGNGNWKWLGGLYGFREDKDHLLQMNYPAYGGVVEDAQSDLDTCGYAAFGQVTYTMFGNLDVTGGLRYDYEHGSIDFDRASTPFAISPDLTFDDSADSDALLPKFQLAYYWNEQIMTYAGVSRGYRSGGFNTGFSDIADASFDPEYSWNYEIGAKTSWFDNRLVLNAAVFYIDLDDQQVTQLLPTANTIIKNAGESRSKGFELEGTALLAQGLTLEAGFGYTNSEFTKYSDPVAGADYKGNKTPLAPKYTYNIALQWRKPIMDKCHMLWSTGPLNFFARAELQGIGDFYWNTANTLKEEAHELVNLRTGLESDHFDLTLWARNLFDEHYRVVAFEFPGSDPVGQAGGPLTFGLTLKARF